MHTVIFEGVYFSLFFFFPVQREEKAKQLSTLISDEILADVAM